MGELSLVPLMVLVLLMNKHFGGNIANDEITSIGVFLDSLVLNTTKLENKKVVTL